MTYLCSIFFILVASVDPLSKNKSRIIIPKLPFFKTARLYTVNTGVTIASLQSVGTVPVLTDVWNKSDTIGEISSCTSFRKWGEILSGPIALVGSRFFNNFDVPSGVIRDRPFNLKWGGGGGGGGVVGYGFLFRSEFFFRTTREFFFVAQSTNFFSRIQH